MTGTRQETAAEYLRAAAERVRSTWPGEFHQAVADWLDEEARRVDDPSVVLVGIFSRRPLEVAGAVLGRPWPS